MCQSASPAHLLTSPSLSSLVWSSLPGESTFAAPPEVTWTLDKEEELRLEIEGKGPEQKVVIKVRSTRAAQEARAFHSHLSDAALTLLPAAAIPPPASL